MSRDSTYDYADGENFVIKNGIFKAVETAYLTEHSSYGEFILERLKDDPKFVGQINGLTEKEETFSEMIEKSVKCAMWLKEQNVQPGDVVAISTDIRMDAYVPVFASLYVGAIFNAWWDVSLTKDIARYFIDLTKPKILFTNEASAAVALKVARETGVKIKVVILGKLPGLPSLEDILATQDSKLVPEFRCTKLASLDAPAQLIYTSGSTGLPKAVLYSNRSLFGNIDLVCKTCTAKDVAVPTTMSFSPLSWITGTVMMFRSIFLPERRVIYPEFKEEATLRLIEKFKVHWMFLGTSAAVRLLKHSSIGNYDISSLKSIYVGGAVFKEETQKALHVMFPHTNIVQAYGCTEMGGVALQQLPNCRQGSCGSLVYNLVMKVIDPETGTILGPNQSGEICFKSPFMMSGYYNNPEATSKAIDSEGWYHTGDLVHYDEEGHVFIIDRIKELIKYRGQHVSPTMIEQVLQCHPGVSEVAVLGIPHDIDDEHAIAFVAKTSASSVTQEQLHKLVVDSLPDYMRLRGGVIFLDQLPHTPSGKVSRTNLRNLIKSYGC